MKTALPLTGVLLALTVSGALAGGVNLNWGTLCYTEAPVYAQHFSCNSNAGSWHMTSSFMTDAEMTDMIGVEITMVGQSAITPLPDWWKLGAAPDCRSGYGQFSSDFRTAPQIACLDWAGGQSVNTYGNSSYTWARDKATIFVSVSIDPSHAFDLLPGTEYYAGDMKILNGKTVGAGSCTGCWWCLYWCVPRITVVGLNGRRDDLTAPLENQWLEWSQCGDPARSSTWGQIKSLYR